MKLSNLEKILLLHIKAYKLYTNQYSDLTTELKFCKTRQWRFDIAWTQHMIAVEAEGGTWTQGRHTSGKGFEQDCEKYNTATLLGWKVFRFTSNQIKSGSAIQTILQALKHHEAKPLPQPMDSSSSISNNPSQKRRQGINQMAQK